MQGPGCALDAQAGIPLSSEATVRWRRCSAVLRLRTDQQDAALGVECRGRPNPESGGTTVVADLDIR